MNPHLLSCAGIAALISSASADITMDWITIGDINNAADTTGYGAVDHAYQIGKYEVTNTQYGAFLNAKGQSNANGIYDPSMASYGITQSGSSGSYSYAVDNALANRPVIYISWFDAARFSNWLGNGQGNGDMETGAYTLDGATSGVITANLGATVYIPTEDEWYKAAYYNPSTSSYSLYPNGQNSPMTTADANFRRSTGASTNVGTYTNDASSYGTFDQGGNVYEWNDLVAYGFARGLRGGSWVDNDSIWMNSNSLSIDFPETTDMIYGFRLASVAVPEPTSLILTMIASGMLLIRWKR